MEDNILRIKMQGGGLFYQVQLDDAVILHHILSYKIHKGNTVYFPKNSLEKVTNILKKNCISFEIINECKYIFKNNNYNTFKLKAYEALDKELRIDYIIRKINNLNINKLEELIKYLEEFFYE